MLVKIVLIVIASYAVGMKINKCCPENQQYSQIGNRLVCISYNGSDTNYWLPAQFNESLYENFTVSFNTVPCPSSRVILSDYFNLTIINDTIALEDEGIFSEDAFCVEKLHSPQNDQIIAYECPCFEKICISKCCSDGFHMQKNTTNDKTVCIKSGNGTDWSHNLLEGARITDYHGVYGHHRCTEPLSDKYLVDIYELREDGSIDSEVDGLIPVDQYCGDFMQKDDEPREPTVIACVLDDVEVKLQSKIYAGLCLVGAFFLLLTTVLHFWMPEIGGSPKWCLAIQAACLLVAYLCLAYQELSPSMFGMNVCKIVAFLMQFSFLASFFWLNVMCIDIASTFSGIKAPLYHQKKKEQKKFMWYSLYAWGGSSFITLSAIVVEFTSFLPKKSRFRPKIGILKCWFKDTEALWVYFYAPVGLLLLSNLIFFAYTIFKIIKLRRGSDALRHDDNSQNNKKNQQRLFLYFKIFLVMGLSWLTEIVSGIIDHDNNFVYFWYVTDAFNLLRAVYIFKFFCWKRKVWICIKKRVSWAIHVEKYFFKTCCKGKLVDDLEEKKTNTTGVEGSDSDHGGGSMKMASHPIA